MRDVVAEAGVVHGAYTPSVVTQAPRWRDVEQSVARWSRNDLAQMLHPEYGSRAGRQRR